MAAARQGSCGLALWAALDSAPRRGGDQSRRPSIRVVRWGCCVCSWQSSERDWGRAGPLLRRGGWALGGGVSFGTMGGDLPPPGGGNWEAKAYSRLANGLGQWWRTFWAQCAQTQGNAQLDSAGAPTPPPAKEEQSILYSRSFEQKMQSHRDASNNRRSESPRKTSSVSVGRW